MDRLRADEVSLGIKPGLQIRDEAQDARPLVGYILELVKMREGLARQDERKRCIKAVADYWFACEQTNETFGEIVDCLTSEIIREIKKLPEEE